MVLDQLLAAVTLPMTQLWGLCFPVTDSLGGPGKPDKCGFVTYVRSYVCECVGNRVKSHVKRHCRLEVSALGVKEEHSNQRASLTDYSSFQQKIIETVSDSQLAPCSIQIPRNGDQCGSWLSSTFHPRSSAAKKSFLLELLINSGETVEFPGSTVIPEEIMDVNKDSLHNCSEMMKHLRFPVARSSFRGPRSTPHNSLWKSGNGFGSKSRPMSLEREAYPGKANAPHDIVVQQGFLLACYDVFGLKETLPLIMSLLNMDLYSDPKIITGKDIFEQLPENILNHI
ncbi:hypothetical protein E5288_WYG001730 [Bos mutus]|uniref:Uncharacterized protein n=1 Tax=Bos mutus TaxID=72004 RepID=A0A6B0RP16_9CETA|nr:hypothetical protein [Bos mutus]